MQGTLVLTIPTVRGSYLQEIEEPLPDGVGTPDTIQWWIASTGSWRIRTYALDHDIHTHFIGTKGNLVELALSNTRKHYGDVMALQHVIELSDRSDMTGTRAAFQTLGLEPRIVIAAGRFAFWKHDDGRYHTQSQPQ